MTEIDSLKEKLSKLYLKAMALHLDAVLREAREKNLSVLKSLHRLAELELERRWQSAVKLRWEQAKLHDRVSIDQFDFDHHKSRKEQKNRILGLLDLGFVHEHMDVVLIGNPGTGKTFLAKCIATAACNANIKVLFTSVMEMIMIWLLSEENLTGKT